MMARLSVVLTAFAMAAWMAGAVAGLNLAERWVSAGALGWNLAVTVTVWAAVALTIYSGATYVLRAIALLRA